MPSSRARSVRYTRLMGTCAVQQGGTCVRCHACAWACVRVWRGSVEALGGGGWGGCADMQQAQCSKVHPSRAPSPPPPLACTPSGAVAHSRSVVYLALSKPPSTGCTFFTALRGCVRGWGCWVGGWGEQAGSAHARKHPLPPCRSPPNPTPPHNHTHTHTQPNTHACAHRLPVAMS